MFHIILDIDNTLIEACMGDYSNIAERKLLPDKVVEILGARWSIWYRPYLRYFLECLRTSKIISTVSFFSMGTKPYCETIINELVPQKRRSERFPYRIFTREDAEEMVVDDRSVYIKNVGRVFWENNDVGADITNTLIIDDNLVPHLMHPFNVIRVKPFSIVNKENITVDTTLRDIFDFLVRYTSMRLPYSLPPCKCMYMKMYLKDDVREFDEHTICFQCALRLNVKTQTIKTVAELYKKWNSNIDWRITSKGERIINQTKIDA